MDYYNMMYGRVRHQELIAEAARESRFVAGGSVSLFTRLADAVKRIVQARASEQRPSAPARRLAAK
jgi:hypothetical protein